MSDGPNIRVFVSYSHADGHHLEQILRYLKGLERDGVTFWTDREISHGARWDDVIKQQIEAADVAFDWRAAWHLDMEHLF